ncbi:MAG: retroviral-like aspartic protease family protein [Tannerella sp.]|jgi:hypothetical protein|nr:retroviral-like aspartic protease family protein [Tannerella sp.]
MKKYIILICVLVLAQFSFAKNKFNPSAGIVTPKNYSTEIPYENVNGKIIIKVEINGKPYRFVFDTGASITTINKNILDTSNHSTFSIELTDQSGKKDSATVDKLNYIRIGNVRFGKVPVATMDVNENPLFKCFNVDGYLGSNLFTHTIVRISSTDKTITFTDKSSTLHLNKKQSSKLFFPSKEDRRPIIVLNFNNGNGTVNEPVVFDVGADCFYRLQLDHLPVFLENNVMQDTVKSMGSSSTGIFGNAENEVMYRVGIPKIEINGAVFKGIKAETIKNQSSMVGSRLFDYGIVIFDYRNSKFYFEPFNEINEINEKLFPISPTVSNGKLVVGVIWDASLENQISIGDQIVSIDDKDYSNLTTCDLFQLNGAFKDKEHITLGIKNINGDIKQITIER